VRDTEDGVERLVIDGGRVQREQQLLHALEIFGRLLEKGLVKLLQIQSTVAGSAGAAGVAVVLGGIGHGVRLERTAAFSG
jgi:hypothetical protein